MRRKRRYSSQARNPNVLGTADEEGVLGQINYLEARSIATLCDREFTGMDVVRSVIDDDTIEKLKAVQGLLYYAPSNGNFGVHFGGVTAPVTISGDFERLHMPVPKVDSEKIKGRTPHAGLQKCLCQMLERHAEWDRVRNVFRFLNEKGTAGAMRYYWPTVLSLTKSSTVHGIDGNRHVPIAGIQEWLSELRDTSAIVASALMIPEDKGTKPQPMFNCWFNINGRVTETWPLI